MRDEQLHAVLARCTPGSEKRQNTPSSKHAILGALLEVEMSKKCTPLRREAFKSGKAHRFPTIFGSRDEVKVHAVVARITFGSRDSVTV